MTTIINQDPIFIEMEITEREGSQRSALQVSHLNIERRKGRLIEEQVVCGVSLSVAPNQAMVLAGEEGCGNSALAQAVAGLLPRKGLQVSGGEIRLGDEYLIGMSPRKLRRLRREKVAYFDRRTMEMLNPLLTIKEHFMEMLAWKTRAEREVGKNLIQALYEVGIAEPESVLACLPHELGIEILSRVIICMALQAGADFIVADEMTASLDATIEQQIIELLVDLKNRKELSILMVTNHPEIIKVVADEILVLYGGVVIEAGKACDVLSSPANSYTKDLIACAPRLGEGRSCLGEISKTGRQSAMEAIESKAVEMGGSSY